MTNSSSTAAAVLLRKYNIFSRADSLLDIAPAARMAAPASASAAATASTSPPFASHLSYYVALACVLLTVYIVQGHRKRKLHLPYYKAAKTKWIFNAEHLVRDSYNKVSLFLVLPRFSFFFFLSSLRSLFGFLLLFLYPRHCHANSFSSTTRCIK